VSSLVLETLWERFFFKKNRTKAAFPRDGRIFLWAKILSPTAHACAETIFRTVRRTVRVLRIQNVFTKKRKLKGAVSKNEHRVAVAVKTVAFPHGFGVKLFEPRDSTSFARREKCRDEAHQRRFRQMKICNHHFCRQKI